MTGGSETLPDGPIRGRGGTVAVGHVSRAIEAGSGADDQHRARSVADDVVGDAAEDEALHPVPAARADDDEVRALGRGRLDDGGPWLALPHEEGHADADAPALHDDRLRCELPGRP